MTQHIAIGVSSFGTENDEPLRLLKKSGCEIVPNPFGRRLNEEEIIQHLHNVDGLIAGLEPLNRKVLSGAKSLKAIARVGIGMDNVDLDASTEFGIKVSNTPDGPTEAVAELTLTALLAMCRNLIPANAKLHHKLWDKTIGTGVRGLNVLIVGFGRIGKKFAEHVRMLGGNILIHDPFQTGTEKKFISLEEGLKMADVISLHASGKETLFSEKQFALMKPGILLLNSARAELVDEKALLEALKNGIVRNAWFDVFWKEPYTGPLTEMESVILTPHVSTYTKQCRLSMEVNAVQNLLRDLKIPAPSVIPAKAGI